MRCEVSTPERRVPANLLVELETPCALQLHNRAAEGLGVNRGALPIKVHLPGHDLSFRSRELGPEEVYEELTKLWSPELGEVAVIGTLGSQVFADYTVTLDLAAGELLLERPLAVPGGPQRRSEDEVLLPLSVRNDLCWVPVTYAQDRTGVLALGTGRYDSYLDEDIAYDLGHPAGDIGPIRADRLDLHAYVAWRPGESRLVHPDGALGQIGLNLLRCLRVRIDRENATVHLTQTVEPDFPEEDLAYFRALVDGQAEAIEAWLEKHPQVRLSAEAGETLVILRLDEAAPKERLEAAVRWFDRTRREDLRTTEALRLMEVLEEAGQREVAIFCGKLGIPSARKDRYPDAVHKIHSRLGRAQYRLGNEREAWRHLLSAAFGMPEDGTTNLFLGRVYEKQGRMRRAFSRYLQAVIKPESGEEAMKGLDRTQRALGSEERISIDEIERLIGGKVLGFGTAVRWRPEPGQEEGRTVLAELFTNPQIERVGIGGMLGFDGLISHFPPERVTVLVHHLPAPEPVPTASAASSRLARAARLRRIPVGLINGVVPTPGRGRGHQREKVYEAARAIIVDELSRRPEHRLSLSASYADGKVQGEVTVEGPGRDGLAVEVLLAERKVLFPGKSEVVLHRMVCRGFLLADAEGTSYRPQEGRQKLAFSRSLADIRAENEDFLASLEASGGGLSSRLGLAIDDRQLVVVALLRDRPSREVLAVSQFRVPAPEKSRGR